MQRLRSATLGYMSESIAWLRTQIQADRCLARMIPGGGFRPPEWRAERLPDDRCAALTMAIGTLASNIPDWDGGEQPESWAAVFAWEQVISSKDEPAERNDDLPVAIVQCGRNEDMHLEAFDPRFAVTDCEAKLAIVAQYEATLGYDNAEDERLSWALETVVEHLASAYRYRDGYAGHWGQAAMGAPTALG